MCLNGILCGGKVWDPKYWYQKWPKRTCPSVNFIFSHCEKFGGWGGGGSRTGMPKQYSNSGLGQVGWQGGWGQGFGGWSPTQEDHLAVLQAWPWQLAHSKQSDPMLHVSEPSPSTPSHPRSVSPHLFLYHHISFSNTPFSLPAHSLPCHSISLYITPSHSISPHPFLYHLIPVCIPPPPSTSPHLFLSSPSVSPGPAEHHPFCFYITTSPCNTPSQPPVTPPGVIRFEIKFFFRALRAHRNSNSIDRIIAQQGGGRDLLERGGGGEGGRGSRGGGKGVQGGGVPPPAGMKIKASPWGGGCRWGVGFISFYATPSPSTPPPSTPCHLITSTSPSVPPHPPLLHPIYFCGTSLYHPILYISQSPSVAPPISLPLYHSSAFNVNPSPPYIIPASIPPHLLLRHHLPSISAHPPLWHPIPCLVACSAWPGLEPHSQNGTLSQLGRTFSRLWLQHLQGCIGRGEVPPPPLPSGCPAHAQPLAH